MEIIHDTTEERFVQVRLKRNSDVLRNTQAKLCYWQKKVNRQCANKFPLHWDSEKIHGIPLTPSLLSSMKTSAKTSHWDEQTTKWEMSRLMAISYKGNTKSLRIMQKQFQNPTFKMKTKK